MADAFYVCDHTGQTTVTISGTQVPACNNGTGRWKRVAEEFNARVPSVLEANPAVIDARIAAYIAANPPASPTGTVTLQPAEMGAAWGAGFVAAATGLVMIWAARSVLNAVSVATK